MRSLSVNYIEQFVFAPFSSDLQQSSISLFFEVPHRRSNSLVLQHGIFFRIFPYFFVNTRNLSTVYVNAQPTAISLLMCCKCNRDRVAVSV